MASVPLIVKNEVEYCFKKVESCFKNVEYFFTKAKFCLRLAQLAETTARNAKFFRKYPAQVAGIGKAWYHKQFFSQEQFSR
ncbi:hypothetical protein GCM10023189_40990 [Nibrella saemangeumensis]|uniref:Uncharacterized protein n=1 Tax=Nibrella saemangeumensis TaxID=1084526 RepID=A0ABP8N8Q1_9BACT